MSEYYKLLWDCIQSDQVSEAQIVEHMKDSGFRKWLEDNGFLSKN